MGLLQISWLACKLCIALVIRPPGHSPAAVLLAYGATAAHAKEHSGQTVSISWWTEESSILDGCCLLTEQDGSHVHPPAADAGGRRGPVVGTCNEMCPEGWYQEAVANNQVTDFEKMDPLGQGRSPRELAVKAFKRSVSPCLPPPVAVCTLWCTASYHWVS